MSAITGDDRQWQMSGYGVLGTGTTRTAVTQDGPVDVDSYGVWGLLGTADDIGNIVDEVTSNTPSTTRRTAILARNALPDQGFAIYGESQPVSSSTTAFGFIAGRSPYAGEMTGVFGQATQRGVIGIATNAEGIGVYGGASGGSVGVVGESQSNDGVQGKSHDKGHTGIVGVNDAGGFGIYAQSDTGSALVARSDRGQAISAYSNNDIGLFLKGATFAAVLNGAVVVNKGDNPTDPNIPPSDINGCIVINEGSLFVNEGDVNINGNLTMRNGGDVILADCAEEFQCSVRSGVIDAGSVVTVDEEGEIQPCRRAYDKKAVGVVSGAGPFRPAIVLDRDESAVDRVPIALVGKVCCKVDAHYGAIEVGDPLTTSPTSGHAMKASDQVSAFGAVIGKALQSLAEGKGLIPILVALQ